MNSAGANSGSNTNSAGSSSAPAIPTNIPIIEPEDMPEPKANEPKANKPTALQIPGLTDALLPTIPVSQVNRSGNGSNMTSFGNRPSPNIVPTNAVKPVLPGVTTQPNPLTPLPGSPVPSDLHKQSGGYHVQTGGNPWSAFMMAAKQAAPAAVLLGAYSMMPRSSGLGRPRSRSRKSRKSRTQRN
jgi:hypothetical protein